MARRKRSRDGSSKSDRKKRATPGEGSSANPRLSRIITQSQSCSRSRSRSHRRREETPSSSSRASGNRFGAILWGKLLRPLPLMRCQQLESICSAFKQSIYSGQCRFVWSKKFQDYLLQTHQKTYFGEQANTFLAYFSAKIGRYCRQLILKVYTFPANYEAILKNFTKLQSTYLKVEANSLIWERFISVTSTNYLSAEFRIFTDPACITERPSVSFAAALAQNEDRLRSLQLWRLEGRNLRQDLLLPKLPRLTKYRIYLESEESLAFFNKFTASHGHRLTSLYLKWEIPAIDAQSLASFGGALAECKAVKLLALTFHWNRLLFPRNSQEVDFKVQLETFCKESLPRTLESLSLDVSNSNFQTQLPNGDLIAHLVAGRRLKCLRIVASLKDVFPLKLPLARLQSLELSLHYNKMNRHFGGMIGPYSLLPFLSNFQRFEVAVTKTSFLFTAGSRLPSVKSLKLCLFPLFDAFLAQHLALVFPCLEMLSFSGYHERAYHKKGESYYVWTFEEFPGTRRITLQDGFKQLLAALPSLRVLRLADKFAKPDLTFLVADFTIRAKDNPEKTYALFIDWKESCPEESKAILDKGLKLPNLRVY